MTVSGATVAFTMSSGTDALSARGTVSGQQVFVHISFVSEGEQGYVDFTFTVANDSITGGNTDWRFTGRGVGGGTSDHLNNFKLQIKGTSESSLLRDNVCIEFEFGGMVQSPVEGSRFNAVMMGRDAVTIWAAQASFFSAAGWPVGSSVHYAIRPAAGCQPTNKTNYVQFKPVEGQVTIKRGLVDGITAAVADQQ